MVTELESVAEIFFNEIRLPTQARVIIEQQLKAAIESGALPPGTRVTQQSVADIFSVSRMPVREALRMLDVQGYLINQPHRGYIVAAPRVHVSGSETLMQTLKPVSQLYQRLTDGTQREAFEQEVIRLLRTAE